MQSIDVIWWLRYGRHSHPQVTVNFLSSFGHRPACYVDLDMMTVMVLVVLMVWALVGTVAILMYLTQPPMGINAAVFIKELIRRMFGGPPCSYWYSYIRLKFTLSATKKWTFHSKVSYIGAQTKSNTNEPPKCEPVNKVLTSKPPTLKVGLPLCWLLSPLQHLRPLGAECQWSSQ